jgi:membrane associated rhomboid family serine protease
LIPLRDSAQGARPPWGTWALIGLCTAAFAIELTSSSLDQLVYEHALIPARMLGLIERIGPFHTEVLAPLVSSMFLHDPGSWGCHFFGNMLFLWIFGSPVEDRFGPLGYLAFYLAGGLAAALVQIAADPASTTPTIGASGAIAGLMGGYLVLRPHGRIHSLVLLPFRISAMQVPALVYLGLWLALQLFQRSADAGVAGWAHVGGFAFGSLAMLALGRGRQT